MARTGGIKMGNALYETGGDGGWSLITNPTNNWSYGYKNTKFEALNLFVDHRENGWKYIGVPGDEDSSIWKNYTSSTMYGILPSQICIHPSRGGKWTTVRWTAPAVGTFHVFGFFGMGDTGRMTYSILYNNVTELFIRNLVYSTENFDFNVTVAKGDTLDFQVGVGWNYGSTPIDITVGNEYFNNESGRQRIRNIKHNLNSEWSKSHKVSVVVAGMPEGYLDVPLGNIGLTDVLLTAGNNQQIVINDGVNEVVYTYNVTGTTYPMTITPISMAVNGTVVTRTWARPPFSTYVSLWYSYNYIPYTQYRIGITTVDSVIEVRIYAHIGIEKPATNPITIWELIWQYVTPSITIKRVNI